jgi:MFS family permease
MKPKRESESNQYRWIMLGLFWLIYFSFGMIRSSIYPLITPITQDLELSNAQIGTILGIFMLVYIFLSLPIGLIIDRIGIRKSLLTGIAVLSLSGILRSYASNYVTMLLSVGLMGLAGPTISVGVPKAIATWFKGEERGTANGIYATGMFIGSATATAITTSIIWPYLGSWRSTLGVYGVFGFLATVIWIFFGKEAGSTQLSGGFSEIIQALKRIVNVREVWLLIAISFCYMLSIYGLQSWLPKLLELKEVDVALAGVLASISSWFGLIGSNALPILGRRISRKYAIILSILIQGISIYVLGTSLGIVLIFTLILYGVFSAGLPPLTFLTLMEVPEVGSEYMGVATGLLFSIMSVGGFLGPYLVGYLLDMTGSTYWGIVLLSVIMELSLIVAFMLKK